MSHSSHARRLGRSTGTFALTAFLLWLCVRPAHANSYVSDDDNFREDVFECEEAAAKIATCCPNYDLSKVQCEYYYSLSETEDACSGRKSFRVVKRLPSLSIGESNCIQQESCADLTALGLCDKEIPQRVFTDSGSGYWSGGDTTPTERESVCQ